MSLKLADIVPDFTEGRPSSMIGPRLCPACSSWRGRIGWRKQRRSEASRAIASCIIPDAQPRYAGAVMELRVQS